MFEMTGLQFLVAFFMSLGGVFVFLWAILAGQFNDMEAPKHYAYRAEVSEDE